MTEVTSRMHVSANGTTILVGNLKMGDPWLLLLLPKAQHGSACSLYHAKQTFSLKLLSHAITCLHLRMGNCDISLGRSKYWGI